MSVTIETRVRYAETDQMGVVYYANYLVWFEMGRTELLRSAGLTYDQLEKEHGLILPVAEARCRYRTPARYDDRILIETRPSQVRGPLVKFAYRLFRANTPEERELLAEGETVHIVCDRQMRSVRLPASYADALKSMVEA